MRPSRRLQHICAMCFAALLLSWPALLNRYPLLYPDSIGYLQDGRPTADALFHHRLVGFAAQRSELYSLGILPFHWHLSPWPIVALNGLLTAWLVWLTLRSIVPRAGVSTYLILIASLSLFTSVSWFVSLVMPDILGAVLYLAIYLLVFARESLSRAERLALAAISLWAITAHATHLMLALGLCLLLGALLALDWSPLAGRRRGIAEIVGLVGLAATCQIGLHAYLYGRPSLDGSRPPYLMARIVADGPGRLYLQQHCPALDWAICDRVADLPDNDDEFLWGSGGIWDTADSSTQKRLLAEEMPLVRATLRAYPRQQLAASWANFIHQLNDFGVNDFDDNDWMHAAIAHVLPHTPYASTLQARNAVPSNIFTVLQRWVVFAALALLLGLAPNLARSGSARLRGLAVVVLPTLVANALVTAVLSSSDSRYQARIVWLLPLLAALALAQRLTTRDFWWRREEGTPGRGSCCESRR